MFGWFLDPSAGPFQTGLVRKAKDVELRLEERDEGRCRCADNETDHGDLDASFGVEELSQQPLEHEEHEDGVEDNLQGGAGGVRLRGGHDAGQDEDERSEIPPRGGRRLWW